MADIISTIISVVIFVGILCVALWVIQRYGTGGMATWLRQKFSAVNQWWYNRKSKA
jgi:hypothetical protein